MSLLEYKNRVVIVTGGAGGLGKAYATFFASRGANVLVNDFSKESCDAAVDEINRLGQGQAVANYDSVTSGDKIIKQAFDKWGRVDILLNNAGILRDKSFKAMTEQEWDQVHDVHVKGSYSCAHAAWPIMRKQKFGRIINTSSAAGIFGNFGQANYASAKAALIAFTLTLAREGEKYGVFVNCIAPMAASKMTETIMPPEVLKSLSPAMVVPIVAYLCHETTSDNGQLFEAGAGYYAKLRLERTRGTVFKTDETFTPAAVAARWGEITDFSSGTEFPTSMTDTKLLEFLEKSKSVNSNPQPSPVRFDNQTAIVTGAGSGLGRSYALMYAKLGASVVVNDVSRENAEKVVAEIKKAGGKAVAVVCSAEEGQEIVRAALAAFGSIHIIVCNAGILRDKSFLAMTDAEWDIVYKVHVKGTFAVIKAAWPLFQKQKYGRIVNTISAVSLFGNYGQANYSTAKGAIHGFTKTLAIEGKKYNILANAIVPTAGTSMTSTIWPEEMVLAFSPDFIAPVVGYLTSQACSTSQGTFEVAGGSVASSRWQRTAGFAFPVDKAVTPEDIRAKWSTICRFDKNATNPVTTTDSIEVIMGNFTNLSSQSSDSSRLDFTDSEDSALVAKAKTAAPEVGEYSYTERDVIIYNLAVGASEKELALVFEGNEDFHAVPTFGVIPQFSTSFAIALDWLPNFSMNMLLHGEQYLAIKAPAPTSGTLISTAQISEVLDKGKAAAVTTFTTTTDKQSGKVIFENQSTLFIRGSGGFGGKKNGADRGPATAANKPPTRTPDAVSEYKTMPIQAALYRLSGDINPLHVDPDFAAVGGFAKPILHGLCFFGIAGKAVYQTFGPFSDIKVRFMGSVYPGETVVTKMWKEGKKVIFISEVKERNAVVLGAAAATLA